MRFRKALCGITAALTVFSSIAVVAQAEEAELKLLTAEFSEISDSESFSFFGDGYFTDRRKFYKIGEEQIAEWNKTGKISVAEVETDFDASGYKWWTGNFEGEYVQLFKDDAAGNVTERRVVSVDKVNNKVKAEYDPGTGSCYTTNDGYTVLDPTSDVANGTVSFTVMRPDGSSFTSTLQSWVEHSNSGNWDDYVWCKYCAVDDEKYCCYAVVGEKTDEQISGVSVKNYAVYAIDKQGNTEKIAGDIKGIACGEVVGGSSGNLAVSFVTDTGAFVLVLSADGKNTRQFDYYGSIYYVGNDKAIGQKMNGIGYDLINTATGQIIANYPFINYIGFVDDNLFMVANREGKEGYIDGNGKELAWFDKAAAFRGDYTPVVKDGKAYLIDRNMNCVSDKIDGDNVFAFAGGLYRVDNGDKSMLIAYVKNSDEPTSEPTSSEPVSSEPTSSEPVSSEPTSEPSSESSTSEPDDSNNPPTGAAALIPVALIGGAAVVVTRKRRK